MKAGQNQAGGFRLNTASEYMNSFQMASYYANSTAASFYSFGHLEHHFKWFAHE